MILNFVVHSIALARQGTILPIVQHITRRNNVEKRLILESNRECTKSLFNLLSHCGNIFTWAVSDMKYHIKLLILRGKNI